MHPHLCPLPSRERKNKVKECLIGDCFGGEYGNIFAMTNERTFYEEI